jgi:glyoxylase-like metal-dependent hydrolase (beta-lactamase superfamily II)
VNTNMKKWIAATGIVVALTSCATRDDAQSALQDADRAMGGASVKTLRYTATGTGWGFGQAYKPGMPWPRANVVSYDRVLDYADNASREEQVRSRAEPTGGTALPLSGEQRTIALWREGIAWSMSGANPVPTPRDAMSRAHDYWISPHAVIKAGMKQPATVVKDGNYRVVSYTLPGLLKASAWIGPDGLVERVASVQSNPVLGDMLTITTYEGYRDFGGVKFPMRIRQTMGGHPVLDLLVGDVRVNGADAIEIPANVRDQREKVTSERAAAGVWFLSGGSHNSVLIEMADHVILVESPLYDGRAQAVLDEIGKLAPGKPLRFVINSHHHFDHSGGLRTAASTGATLVTSELARTWWDETLANPNTIAPDAFARSGAHAKVVGVEGQRTFTDGRRTVHVVEMDGSVHSQGFLLVWLPRERILIEADAYTPAPPNTPPPANANANNVNLVANIERLQMDPELILPLHGRMVEASELYTAVGRRKP